MGNLKSCFCQVKCSCGEGILSAETSLTSDKIKIICAECGKVVFITSKTRLEEPADTQNEYRAVIKE